MKFAHIADLHIGKRVHDFSMLEDQRYILEEMLRIFDEEKVDGVLIAGDVYDKTVPSAEAVQVFDDFITKLAKMEMPIYMISGNHDSAERLAFGAQLFENDGVYISPVYEGEVKKVEVEDVYGTVNIWLLPLFFLFFFSFRRQYAVFSAEKNIGMIVARLRVRGKKPAENIIMHLF